MPAKNTLFDRFLSPVFQLLIDREALDKVYEQTDWQTEGDRFRNPQITYPDYYQQQNFHGVKNGYLNPRAAVSYDPVTQYVLVPNEAIVRQTVVEAIQGQPRRILDLGCGTGSTTLLLKQAFPDAEVIGVDLSPYMLVMADLKAQKAGLNIAWQHRAAESTGFPEASFDVVTASLLFHETPPAIAQAVLREAFRLLQPGGQVVILDGNQSTLRQTDWLTQVFEEPYMQDYAKGSVDAWLGAAGFAAVRTQEFWWVHQVSQGQKPTQVSGPQRVSTHTTIPYDVSGEFDACPAF